MAELIAVLIIMGVLAAIALPRFSASTYGSDELRLYDQTVAALRYAQRTAIAMQRTVCATFSGGNQLALSYSSAYSPPSCDTPLPPPGGVGGSTQYVVSGQGASYSAGSTFSYDRVGRPSAGQTITVSGGRPIVVEPETGYVR